MNTFPWINLIAMLGCFWGAFYAPYRTWFGFWLNLSFSAANAVFVLMWIFS